MAFGYLVVSIFIKTIFGKGLVEFSNYIFNNFFFCKNVVKLILVPIFKSEVDAL